MGCLDLLALCDTIGVVGVKFIVEQVNMLIFENLIKIKAIVSQNKEILQSLRINFDRPDMMRDLYKRLESKLLFNMVGREETPQSKSKLSRRVIRCVPWVFTYI